LTATPARPAARRWTRRCARGRTRRRPRGP
jgi:hypothetical protein